MEVVYLLYLHLGPEAEDFDPLRDPERFMFKAVCESVEAAWFRASRLTKNSQELMAIPDSTREVTEVKGRTKVRLLGDAGYWNTEVVIVEQNETHVSVRYGESVETGEDVCEHFRIVPQDIVRRPPAID